MFGKSCLFVDTVKSRYNEGQRPDWQICSLYRRFVISWFFFIYFTITRVKKIVRYIGYTEDFVIWRFVISRFHCTKQHSFDKEKRGNFNIQRSRFHRTFKISLTSAAREAKEMAWNRSCVIQ